MTTLLYIGFYVWLAGAILLGTFMFAAIRIMGGREEFTLFFNKMQDKNYDVTHIDWALVIAVTFWPQTLAAALLNRSIKKRQTVDTTSNP